MKGKNKESRKTGEKSPRVKLKPNLKKADKKGLSDKELIEKYESGSIDLGKQLKTAINKN